MPEWPEMEHYKRLLNHTAKGQLITDVITQREKSLNVPISEFTRRVCTRRIVEVTRRAKMLLFHLDSEDTLLLHLMLGGVICYGSEAEKPDRTVQVTLQFGKQRLYFIGLRLGYLHIYNDEQVTERLSNLGIEPFDPLLVESTFSDRITSIRRPLKVTLTDQSILAGIGNCYSDEICFAAKLLPSRKANELTAEERSTLFMGMRNVLREAVDYGGYMDRPFQTGDRITGGYDSRCKVYDREDQPCVRCGTPIRRAEIASKKTFYCPNCQR